MTGISNETIAINLAAKIRANVVGLRHTTASVRDGAAYNRYIDNLLDAADTLDPPRFAPTCERSCENEATDENQETASVLSMSHRFSDSTAKTVPGRISLPRHKPTPFIGKDNNGDSGLQSSVQSDNLNLDSVRRLNNGKIGTKQRAPDTPASR